MDNVDCEHCFRHICPYKHDYILCKNNNKRIQKKYTEPPTILEKILTEYQLYICSIKKNIKLVDLGLISVSVWVYYLGNIHKHMLYLK